MTDNLDLVLLAKILGQLGDDHPGPRDEAARRAHQMITNAKTTWNDLLGVPDHSAIAAPANHTPTSFKDIFPTSLDGIFAHYKKNCSQQEASRPTTQPTTKDFYFTGSTIPQTITGTVSISDRRKTRTGEMAVVTVTTNTASTRGTVNHYGPISIFNQADIEAVAAEASPAAIFTLQVQQPTNARYAPSARIVRGRSQ